MGWKYDRLPDSKLQSVKTALETNNAKTLILLHNYYQLSNYNYCCSTSGLFTHFKKLIDEREDNK